MLKGLLNRIASDSLVYGLGNGITKFVQVITLPIISNALSVSEFGDWNLLTLVTLVLSSFMVFGMENAAIRFLYDKDSKNYKRELFTTGVLFMAFLSLVFGFLFWSLQDVILNVLNLSDDYHAAYRICVVWMPAAALQIFFLNWFKWTLQKWKFIIISFGYVFLSVLILLILMSKNLLSVENILLSAAISQWIAILIGLSMCLNQFSLQIDLNLLKRMVIYGMPFMLVMLIGALRNSMDRFILTEYSNGDHQLVGLYSMGQRLAMVMNFFVFTLDIAIGPMILSNWEQPDAKNTFARLQRYYLMLMNGVAICLCALAPWLVYFLATDEYLPIVNYFPLIIIGNYLVGLYLFASIGILYSKKSYLNTIALALSLFVLYLVATIITPIYLEWGVAIAYFISMVIMLVCGYCFSNRFYSIPFNWKSDLLTMLVGVFICFVTVNLKILKDPLLNCVPVLILMGIIYLGYIWIMLTQNERAFMKKGIAKVF